MRRNDTEIIFSELRLRFYDDDTHAYSGIIMAKYDYLGRQEAYIIAQVSPGNYRAISLNCGNREMDYDDIHVSSKKVYDDLVKKGFKEAVKITITPKFFC